MKLKGFKTYIAEGGRSRGEEMEHVIVNAFNGKKYKTSAIPNSDKVGQKIVDYLLTQKGVSKSDKAEVLGASTVDTTEYWAQFFEGGVVPPMTKTPKTDIQIGKLGISLKTGDAQLMSGGASESKATFYSAMEQNTGRKNKIVKELEELFNDFAPSSVAAGNLTDVIKSGKDEMVNKANEAHKKFQQKLTVAFEKDPDFGFNFISEAMSGITKFGKKSVGSASHFLTCDWTGDNVHLASVTDKKYVNKIASLTKPSVRFKTTSVKKKIDGKTVKTGEYRYWSVIGLVTSKINEEFDALDGQYLTEGIISDTWGKIKNFIKSLFTKVVDWIKQNVKNLLDFFDMEPEVTYNEIDWGKLTV